VVEVVQHIEDYHGVWRAVVGDAEVRVHDFRAPRRIRGEGAPRAACALISTPT
jgi:hypothetical protein